MVSEPMAVCTGSYSSATLFSGRSSYTTNNNTHAVNTGGWVMRSVTRGYAELPYRQWAGHVEERPL